MNQENKQKIEKKLIECREALREIARRDGRIPNPPILNKKRDFQNPLQDRHNHWDRILITGHQNEILFHVLGKQLANHCKFFKDTFTYNEKDALTLDLTAVNPALLQLFLEALYGEISLTEEYVVDVCRLAHVWGSPSVKNACENFFILESNKTWEEKFTYSMYYGLINLRKFLINGIKSYKTFKTFMKRKKINEWDNKTKAIIIKKSMEFHRGPIPVITIDD